MIYIGETGCRIENRLKEPVTAKGDRNNFLYVTHFIEMDTNLQTH